MLLGLWVSYSVFLSIKRASVIRSSESNLGSSTLDDTYFQLDTEGHVKKLIGFLGSSSVCINSLGAHFWIQAPTFETNPHLEIVSPGGVNGQGFSFDDVIFDGVSKLTARIFANCISFLRINYVQ